MKAGVRASVLAITIVGAILSGGGCTALATEKSGKSEQGEKRASQATPEHNARNSLDWAGTYRGTLPCADCPGIETVVRLGSDGTFRTQSRYLGKNGTVSQGEGRFVWNEAGNTITFLDSPSTSYFVAENRIIRLKEDGTRVTGNLAEHYVMTKITDGVTEKYWKLVELMGQPVPTLEREPHLVLRTDGNRVTGFGGCNNFTGTYELDEATSRIRFGKIASTMMACDPEKEAVEKAFHNVLNTADNFSRNGDRMTLNRARMAPLARFEAVYLR